MYVHVPLSCFIFSIIPYPPKQKTLPDQRPEGIFTSSIQKLYLDQKHTLDLFLERGAISQAQYDKSLGDLTEKMGMDKPE